MLEITKEKNDQSMTVFLSGRLDTDTVSDYEAQVLGDLDGVKNVTLDMADVTYISSAGLRMLLMTAKNVEGEFALANVTDNVKEIFEMTGMMDILNII